ncbi:MAG: hypothetical protein GY941_13630, partial [Planctomycetes bacterium]|nr:hypothetical protein [Planctomycetota bacterium]
NMTDLICKYCALKGNIEKCLSADCAQHDSWYAKEQQEKIEELQDTLTLIAEWCEAYPLKIFPEPDLKKADKVLKENGITIDSIGAHAMRHVLKGIQAIIAVDNQR